MKRDSSFLENIIRWQCASKFIPETNGKRFILSEVKNISDRKF